MTPSLPVISIMAMPLPEGVLAPVVQVDARDPKTRLRVARTTWFGSAKSLIAHALVIAFLLFGPSLTGGRKAGGPHAVQVVFVSQSTDIAPPTPAPAEPTPPPQPVTPTKPEEKQAVKKPQPAAKPKPAASAGATAKTEAQQPSQADTDALSLLNGVRGNWLQPPNIPLFFRCQIKIDYQAGGIVTAVTVINGCGKDLLDDSIERAIWKTQPLPILAARNQAGSIILDFTPR